MKTLLAYLQLTRLPNLFTAMADIFLGFLFVHAALAPLHRFLLLLTASSCLYLAGMVLNDLFDYQLDSRERPQRPLPSGRVSRLAALRLALALLALGLAAGWLAGWWSGAVSTMLVASIFLYDGWLKATPLGPFLMGCCRALNVFLGMSASAQGLPALLVSSPAAWQVPAGLGVYVAGLTWFARREAQQSARGQLALAAGVINLAFAALASIAVAPPFAYPRRFWLLLTVTVWIIDRRLLSAIVSPHPTHVQIAVKTCLLSLVLLDAAIVCGIREPWLALAVAILVVPAAVLGRWVYST